MVVEGQVVAAVVSAEGLLHFVEDGLVVAAELLAAELQRGQEELVVVGLEPEDEGLVVVVEVGHRPDDEQVVALVQRVQEAVDALDYLEHEGVVEAAAEAAVVVEDAGELGDVAGREVELEAAQQPLHDALAEGQPVAREDLQHVDRNGHLLLGEVLCGLDEGHEAVLVAVEVLVGEGAVVAQVEQRRQEHLQAQLLLGLLQVALQELQQRQVVQLEAAGHRDEAALHGGRQLRQAGRAAVEEEGEGVADEPGVVVAVVEVLQLLGAVNDAVEVEDDEVRLDLPHLLLRLQVPPQLLQVDVHVGELGDHAREDLDGDLLPVLPDELSGWLLLRKGLVFRLVAAGDEGQQSVPGGLAGLPEAVLEEDEVVQPELDWVHAELEHPLAVALEQLPHLAAPPLGHHRLQRLDPQRPGPAEPAPPAPPQPRPRPQHSLHHNCNQLWQVL